MLGYAYAPLSADMLARRGVDIGGANDVAVDKGLPLIQELLPRLMPNWTLKQWAKEWY